MTDYRSFLWPRSSPVPDQSCEVLFYGDVHAPRRQELLRVLEQHFRLRVVGNAFGTDLHRAVLGARVVVNLHYYEGALLETTRIYECLSLGARVVSERATDQAEHVALEGVVRFVPAGDAAALVEAVRQELAATPDIAARQAHLAASQCRFRFMLWRVLLAHRLLGFDAFLQLTAGTPLDGHKLALSLPETPARRTEFQAHRPPGVHLFDGLRYTPGWIGCAMSYRYLAQRALEHGVPQLEIMEDDVVFPPDYARRRAVVDRYLAQHHGRWDAFVGLMALLHPDTRILAVERFEGELFVTIDRMISMVHNIYAPAALRVLRDWDPDNEDPEANTIDRYLQGRDSLRVVTTLPFLVQHHEQLASSLWGVQNVRYSGLIRQAQQKLAERVRAHERRIAAVDPG